MTIYPNKKINYRKIYEKHHGPIPKDQDGKTYDIHHIDGDRSNNDPSNLKAVSLQDHYDLHHAQQDWSACARLAHRLGMSKEHITDLARKNALRRVEQGTHNFIGLNQKRVADGTHHWLGGQYQREAALRRIANGDRPFVNKTSDGTGKVKRRKPKSGPKPDGQKQRVAMKQRVEEGIHHFTSSEWQRNRAAKQIADGYHPSQVKASCVHCRRSGGYYAMRKFHFDNCKYKCE